MIIISHVSSKSPDYCPGFALFDWFVIIELNAGSRSGDLAAAFKIQLANSNKFIPLGF